MIDKHRLEEKVYYIGTCRNTNIAQWVNGEFIFINYNFNQPYIERIEYYGDVVNLSYDGFIPITKIYVNYNDINNAKIAQDYKNGARKLYLNINTNDIKDEVWKPIIEYEALYYISNLGRIKKYDGNKIMKQNFSRDYLIVGLTNYHGIRKTLRVHRLVAQAFKIDSNLDLVVNHINGVKTDNREINLEWVTRSQNSKHTFLSGNKHKKLKVNDVIKIKKLLKEGEIQIKIAKQFNISRSTISEINTGKKWVDIS